MVSIILNRHTLCAGQPGVTHLASCCEAPRHHVNVRARAHAQSAICGSVFPDERKLYFATFGNTTKVNCRKSACVLHAVKVEGLDHSNGVPLSEYGAALAAAAFGAVFLPVLHTIIPLNPCDRRMSLTCYVAIIMGSRIAGAAWFGHLNVNGALLLKAFGWYTVAHVTSCAISNSVDFDKVGSVVAPAALAAYALELMPVPTIAVGLLGFYLSRELEGPPWYVFTAALATALYFGYGAVGFVAAYAYGTAVRLVNGLEHSRIPLVSMPVLAICGFAYSQDKVSLWVMCLALGELGQAAIALLQALANKEPNGLKEP